MASRRSISPELWAGLEEIAKARMVTPNVVLEILLSNAITQFRGGVDPLLSIGGVPMGGSRAAPGPVGSKRAPGRPPLPTEVDITLPADPDRVIVKGVPRKHPVPEPVLHQLLKYTPYLPVRLVPDHERPNSDCQYQDTEGHYFCEGVPIDPRGQFRPYDATTDNPRRIYPEWWDQVYGEGSRQRIIDAMYEQAEADSKDGNTGVAFKLVRWDEENKRVDWDPKGEEKLRELNREHLKKLQRKQEQC